MICMYEVSWHKCLTGDHTTKNTHSEVPGWESVGHAGEQHAHTQEVQQHVSCDGGDDEDVSKDSITNIGVEGAEVIIVWVVNTS